MPPPLWRLSAVETAQAIVAGEASAEEVILAHTERLRAVNPALNAVVVDLTAAALETARGHDRAVRQAGREGEPLGPLHGVPVTIKINIDVAGHANSNGVVGLKDAIATDDAPVVANLRKAGAIVIGLTNTPEFSMRAFTDNPLHGLTRNPWDAAITCGGSSGGAGASVAAGIGAIAHGNDIGGSLRGPASCNGVSTIKPTLGRVPAFNPSASVERPPLAQLMSVQGPLAREVRDVRLGLEAMCARDPRDPWWVPAPLTGPPIQGPIKVAVAAVPPDMECDPRVLALVGEAADHLADAGYAVEAVKTPDIDAAWRLWCDLLMTELTVMQADQMLALGGEDFRDVLAGFLKMATILDQRGYMEAVARRTALLRDWLLFLEDWPLILAPHAVRPTPEVNADLGGEDRVRELFWNDMRFMSAINVLGLPAACVPAGLVDGAPVGVQLIASRYREDLCLDAAEAIEARVGVMATRLWERI